MNGRSKYVTRQLKLLVALVVGFYGSHCKVLLYYDSLCSAVAARSQSIRVFTQFELEYKNKESHDCCHHLQESDIFNRKGYKNHHIITHKVSLHEELTGDEQQKSLLQSVPLSTPSIF